METLRFENQSEYKIGPVTYIVTAHFKEDTEPIQSKIEKLLKKDIDSGIID